MVADLSVKAKHPKLADGVTGSARAMKKLEKEATGTKHVLSANAEVQVKMEGLPQPGGGVDGVLQLTLSRTQYEDMVSVIST